MGPLLGPAVGPIVGAWVAEKSTWRWMFYATSIVTRAATPETRAHVPYNIVLIDAAEGFRMMAHGDHDLKIGDQVRAQYRRFTDRLVPYFTRTTS